MVLAQRVIFLLDRLWLSPSSYTTNPSTYAKKNRRSPYYQAPWTWPSLCSFSLRKKITQLQFDLPSSLPLLYYSLFVLFCFSPLSLLKPFFWNVFFVNFCLVSQVLELACSGSEFLLSLALYSDVPVSITDWRWSPFLARGHAEWSILRSVDHDSPFLVSTLTTSLRSFSQWGLSFRHSRPLIALQLSS